MWLIISKAITVSKNPFWNKKVKRIPKFVFIAEAIDFKKATVVSAIIGDALELKCNTSLIDASIWVVTQNKIGLFQVEPSNRYNINSDLRISGLEIADEEYYACGYLDNGNNFVSISTYFVFVKGKKNFKKHTIYFNKYFLQYHHP